MIADTVTLGVAEKRLTTALVPTAKLRLHDDWPASIAGNHGLVTLAVNRTLPFGDVLFLLTGEPENVTLVKGRRDGDVSYNAT